MSRGMLGGVDRVVCGTGVWLVCWGGGVRT